MYKYCMNNKLIHILIWTYMSNIDWTYIDIDWIYICMYRPWNLKIPFFPEKVSGVFSSLFPKWFQKKAGKSPKKNPENFSGKKWNLFKFYSQLLSIRINVVAFRPAWIISESCTIEAIVCYAVSCQYIYKLRAWILEAFQLFLFPIHQVPLKRFQVIEGNNKIWFSYQNTKHPF